MKSLVKVLLCLAAFSPFGMNAQFCGSSCNTSCNPCCGDDYYISVWGGGNAPFNNHPKLDTGWYVGGAIGLRCSPCMRYDVSFDYLSNDLDRHTSGNEEYSSSSHKDSVNKYVVLANAYYDFQACGCFVPYVGAGVGYAYTSDNHHHNFDNSDSSSHHNHKNAFAWQVGAGVNYDITECWSAALSYRLLGTVNDRSSYHNLFGVGLTRKF